MVRRRTDGVHPIVRRGDPPGKRRHHLPARFLWMLGSAAAIASFGGPSAQYKDMRQRSARNAPPTADVPEVPEKTPPAGCRGQPRSVGRTCTWTRLLTGSSKVHHRGDVMDSAERHRPREMPEPPGDPPTGANVPHAPAATRTPCGAGRVRHPAHLYPDMRLRRAGFSP